MKHFGFSKSLLLLTSLMLSAWIFVYAQDYIKVYRNGQKVNEFYTTEVDSIVMLPKEDGSGYNVTYWTGDTVFTIPDNEHDSTAIGHITIEEIAHEIESATTVAGELFSHCSTISELVSHIDEIRNADGVEDVYYSNQTLFVKIKGWGTIQYCYPPTMPEVEEEIANARMTDQITANTLSSYPIHNYMDSKSICIANWFSTNHDPNYNYARKNAEFANYYFSELKYRTSEVSPTPEFLSGGIYNYDVVFLITHGTYDPKTYLHWLATSEEVATEKLSLEDCLNILTGKFEKWEERGMTIMCFSDIRNNRRENVYYYGISNNYIASRGGTFSNYGKAIVFNVACKSIMGNYNLANTYLNKGAGIYFGYDNSNNSGPGAGRFLFYFMLNGMSAQTAIKHVRSLRYDPDPYCGARLWGCLNGSVNNSRMLSLVQTKMGDIEDESDDEGTKIKVKGSVKLYSPNVVNHTYGFYLSEKNDFESGEMLPGFKLGSSGCKVTNGHTVEFEQTLTDKELEAGKSYFICPYLFDGESYCLAEKLEPLYANSVETLEPGYAKADIALLQGQFICGKAVEEAGFRIGTTEDLKEFVDIKVNEAYGRLQANYWSVVTGLHPSIKYYYKSYVKVDGKTITGNMMTLQTSRVIDGEITSYDHKASGYVVTDNNGYVGFITNMKYKAPLMSSSTTQWGIYMDNYNNTGEANGWASSLGNSATEDSQDITVLITKSWFETKNYSSFQAVKKARMGVYKVVQYDGGSDVFFSEPQEVTFIYDQKPYLEFLSHNCTKPVTATDPYDGKEKWKTTVYGNYSVTGSFWVNKIDFVVESGDASDHVGTWTIEGDGTKKYSINYYTSKNLEYYSSKFRFDMILDNGARVRSANSIILEVTSSSRTTDVTPIIGEQYSNGVKGASLHSTTKDRDFQLKSIKPLKSGLKTDENFSCPVLQR